MTLAHLALGFLALRWSERACRRNNITPATRPDRAAMTPPVDDTFKLKKINGMSFFFTIPYFCFQFTMFLILAGGR